MTQFSAPITYSRPWSRFWSSMSTFGSALTAAGSRADVLDSATAPGTAMLALNSASTGRAVLPVGPGSLLLAGFYGTTTAAQTLSGRVWLWRRIEADGTIVQYTPTYLCDLAITLGAKTGIASGFVTASHLYADVISITTDGGLLPNQTRTLGSAGTMLQLVVDPAGSDFVEIDLTISGGTAVSFNGLWSAVNGG